MVLKNDIERAIKAQSKLFKSKETDINRTFLDSFLPTGKHIEVISGMRRCGKSTLMHLIAEQHYKKTAYFNFEDSRIHGFEVHDFEKLDELFGGGIEAYFFDEIQNVPAWEVFIRQLHDRNEKVFVTGSNAALLSKELGTRLTGRHMRHELFPFSYPEFLRYKKLEANASSLSYYLRAGGFPEYLETENPEVLQYLFKDVIYRDIAVRYGVRNTHSLIDISLFLLTNVGKEISYNNLRKIFALGSANTVSDYLAWLADAYIFFFLPKFSWSLKSIAINPRKVYAIDNGLINANTLSHSENRGRLLENMVYLFLRQRRKNLFYFKENHECDFVVIDGSKCIALIQVCEVLNGDNLKRELDGLYEAMLFFNFDDGYILTHDQTDHLQVKEKHVHIMPIYNFCNKFQ